MNFSENKFELGLVGFFVLAIVGLFQLFGSISSSDQVVPNEISYEMPRPKADLAGDFDLDGREIERNFVNPFDKKKKEAQKEAAKKKAAAPAKKPAVAKAEEKKEETVAGNDVDVNIVGRESERGSSPETAGSGAQHVQIQNRATAGAAEAADANDDRLSPDQWRAMVLGAPTKENMAKLVAAYQEGKVDDGTFYGIIEDLMESQKPESQALALSGLRTVTTAKSFVLVAHKMNELSPQVKSAAQDYLMQYNHNQRLSVLAQVLQMNDVIAVTKASEIVLAGAQRARSGQTVTTTPREARGEVQTASLDSYSRFIPIYQRWAQSGNSTLQALASSVLAQLQQTIAS